MFIKYYDQSIAYNLLLKYGLELTLFKVKFLILLLFWVGGWGKLILKTNSVQLRLKLGLSFAKITLLLNNGKKSSFFCRS